MSEQLLIALIGAIATVVAAVVGAYASYSKKNKPRSEEQTGWRKHRFEFIYGGVAGFFAAALIGGAYYFWGHSSELVLYGVGSDWNYSTQPPKVFLYEDELRLTVTRDNAVRGVSKSYVIQRDGAKKPHSWPVSGFLVGPQLTLSYGTADSLSGGSGAYYLSRFGEDYVGHSLMKQPNGDTLLCPYATRHVSGNGIGQRSQEEWKRIYPKLFADNCRLVILRDISP